MTIPEYIEIKLDFDKGDGFRDITFTYPMAKIKEAAEHFKAFVKRELAGAKFAVQMPWYFTDYSVYDEDDDGSRRYDYAHVWQFRIKQKGAEF